MKRYLRYLWIGLMGLLLAGPTSQAQDAARMLAEAYGIGGWDAFERLEFTFNVENAKGHTARSWDWNIAEGRVTRQVDGEQVGIALDAAEDEQNEQWKQVHRQFINDSYWLLFPFQLVWSDPEVTMADEAEATPIGGGLALKVTAQWPAEGGYTPGDAYDLYLDERGLIDQWVFRKGGQDTGNASTWTDHRQLGPIIVCLNHANADGSFRLYFSDVRANIAGEQGQVQPDASVEP